MNAKTIFQLIAQKLQQNDLNGAKDLFFASREELYEENPMLTLKTNFEPAIKGLNRLDEKQR